MKKIYLKIILSFFVANIYAQNPGDTIIVQTFDYSMTYGNAWDGTVRDTMAYFPNNPNLSFEKIIMAYSMRCRNGQVNTSGGNSVACGEWDYSCHTYIHDSSRVDSVMHKIVSHEISNFSGSTYNYSINPTYTFVQNINGSYDTTMIIADTVHQYNIISNPSSLVNDIIDTTTFVYWPPFNYTYDSIGNIINVDTLISGTINIGELTYYKRYPMKFQIMSFVTPYGINLDLGPEGKTWYFDLTDYAPVFQGPKRITVSGGGQWQEDMDIKFLFIVGTPPRDVVDMQQIWRPQSKGYSSIMNNSAFEPRNVIMNPNASSYKLKSVITGHGQEGEFIPRNHYINIDGGTQDYIWQVWTPCAGNPVYPQGGTWIYDRAGWCPGQASDIKEIDITNLVSPAQLHNIDYGVVTASGTSNYWVSNQLVSYGPANFSLDASIVDILSPSNEIKDSRQNPTCNNPKIVIQNTGNTTLTSLKIEYWINDDSTPTSYNWTGSLEFLEKEIVELPINTSFWNAIDYNQGEVLGEVVTFENIASNNKFYVDISNPNNNNDSYQYNNSMSKEFTPAPKYPRIFTFWSQTNNGTIGGVSETSWEIIDSQSNPIYSWNNLPPNTQFKDTINLSDGCYTFKVTDIDNDGLDFWGNNDGGGMLRFRRLQPFIDTSATPWTYHNWFKTFELDFGSFIHHEFLIASNPLSISDNLKENINVYPNPANESFFIDGYVGNNSKLLIIDQMGKIIYSEKINSHFIRKSINFEKYSAGLYTIKIKSPKVEIYKKIVKQ